MTEWYDEGEPPDTGMKFLDEDTCLPWSSLYPGVRLRWTTPKFVKRGTLVSASKRTMVIHFDGHAKPTVIPDAKWYFVEGKVGNKNEHLVTISTPPLEVKRPESLEGQDDLVTPAEAAAYLGTDPKNIRRKIRNGTIRAYREGGRWVIRRDDLI